MNRDQATIDLARKALLQYPHSSYLHFLLAKSLLSANKPDQAKREFQQAVDLDPSNEEAADELRGSFK